MEKDLMIIEDMKKLGLSEYEAKAYLKLIEDYPVNGYTLSKNSGIPRSRIYEVLDSLKKKQIVFEQIEGKNTLYQPLDPKLLINKFKNSFENVFTNINDYAKEIYSKDDSNNKLVVVKGRTKILDLLRLLISEAKKRIALSIWEEEINDIIDPLKDATKRGVMVKGIYFGKNNPLKELVTHRRIERYLSEKTERYMVIIIDEIYGVSGVISRGENSQVTWTKDPGIIDISEDYIAHDLMVNVYSNQLSDDEKKKFEEFSDRVRKDYYGFSDEEFSKFK